ncbi:MAG: nucleotidyltransferase family protein [Actinomycetota bacterium]|nr:nucleotidyltransferase family protein [Actinomycetota bacterium]
MSQLERGSSWTGEPASGALASWTVPPDATVREALTALARHGHTAAVVTSDDGSLLGTFSDGDARLAVMRGSGLETAVSAVMNKTPVVAPTGASEDDVLALMRRHRVRSVPLVDGGRPVEMRSLSGFPDPEAEPVAVIMAGGRGQRLRPFTDKVPKPLLRIGATSIVERIINALSAAGVRQFFLAVNYKAEAFEQRLGTGEAMGVELRYLREEQAMGTAGALSLLPPDVRGPIVVMNGDIVTTVDFEKLFDFHWHGGAAATVAGVEHLSPIPYGVLQTADHHLLSIEEKPERRDFCSAGICVLDAEVLRYLTPGRPLDMPDLIAQIVADGQPVQVFPILEKWFDIGGTAEFERVLVQFAIGEEELV